MDAATPKKPTSIWPGNALLDYLKMLGPRRRNEGLSQVVDNLAARYLYVTRSSLPKLVFEEWSLILDTLIDHDLRNVQNLRLMGMLVQTAVEQRRTAGQAAGLGTNFGYDAKRMNEAQQVAVVEVVEGYRRRHGSHAPELLKAWLQELRAPGFEHEQAEGQG
jgi:hypothetical protein